MNLNKRTTIRWPSHDYRKVRRYAEAHKFTLSTAIRDMLIKQITLSADQYTDIAEE